VIDVQVFTREGIERDKRAAQIIDDELKGYRKTLTISFALSKTTRSHVWKSCLLGKTANGGPKRLAKGTRLTKEYLEGTNRPRLVSTSARQRGIRRQLER